MLWFFTPIEPLPHRYAQQCLHSWGWWSKMKNNHHQGRIQMAVQKCGPLPLTVPIEIKLLLNVIKLSYKIYGKFIFYMYKGYEKKSWYPLLSHLNNGYYKHKLVRNKQQLILSCIDILLHLNLTLTLCTKTTRGFILNHLAF